MLVYPMVMVSPVTPEKLKRIRSALRWTQEKLAAEVGVTRVSVARWETGVRGISEPVARLIRSLEKEGEARKKPRR